MKSDYLYRVGTNESKPISWEVLQQLYQSKQLPDDAMARRSDDTTWQPIHQLIAAKQAEAKPQTHSWQDWARQTIRFAAEVAADMGQHLKSLGVAGLATIRWGWQRQRASEAQVALGVDRHRSGLGSEATRARLQQLDEKIANGNFAQRWWAGFQRRLVHHQLGGEKLTESASTATAACREAEAATVELSSQAASAWQKLWPANRATAGRLAVAYASVFLIALFLWRIVSPHEAELAPSSAVLARQEVPPRNQVPLPGPLQNMPIAPDNNRRAQDKQTPPVRPKPLAPNNGQATPKNLSDVPDMLSASLRPGKFQPKKQGQAATGTPPLNTVPATTTSPPIILSGRPADVQAAYIGYSIGKNAGDAIRSASALRNAGGDWSREIQTARQDYWNALRTGKNVAECREIFGNQLAAKDFWYFLEYMPMLGDDAARARVLQLIAGKIDGGIPASAKRSFVSWGTVFVQKVERRKREYPQQSFVEHLIAAHADEDVQQVHRNYMRARNWAELDASGIQFAWDEDDDAHVRMVLARYGEFRTPEQVEKIIAMLRALFGDERYRKVAHELRVYPRGDDGLLAVPQQEQRFISTYPDAALWAMLGQQDAEAFLAYKIHQEPGIPEETIRAVVNRWYDAYGRENVLAAVEPLRTAPLGEYGWLRDPISLGSYRTAWHQTPYVALRDILSKKYPRGHVRAMIAFHEKTNSAAEIDQRIDELKRRYGEAPLLAAQQAILRFHETPNGELLPAVIKRRESLKRGPEGGNDYALLIDVLERGSAEMLGDLTLQQREPTELSKHWLRFGVGTSVTHVTTFYKTERGKQTKAPDTYFHTHRIAEINDEMIQLLRIEQRVDEVNNFGRKSINKRPPRESQDRVIRWAKAGDPLTGRTANFPIYSTEHGRSYRDQLAADPRQGKEQLSLLGKSLDCETWEFVYKPSSERSSPDYVTLMTRKIWLCDEIPGRLVKKVQTTESQSKGKTTSQSSSEQVLSSFTIVPAK